MCFNDLMIWSYSMSIIFVGSSILFWTFVFFNKMLFKVFPLLTIFSAYIHDRNNIRKFNSHIFHNQVFDPTHICFSHWCWPNKVMQHIWNVLAMFFKLFALMLRSYLERCLLCIKFPIFVIFLSVLTFSLAKDLMLFTPGITDDIALAFNECKSKKT